MIMINCDIGERGPHHPVDIELMNYIDIANIACGGHAGDRESVSVFKGIADSLGVKVSAHLSYPDRENFGRLSVNMKIPDLLDSLVEQYSMLRAGTVKFHGALYNDSVTDTDLASALSLWLKKMDVAEIIAPADSEIALLCADKGIDVIEEAFAERRYDYNSETGRLTLVSRKESHASIESLEEALAHSRNIIEKGIVAACADGMGMGKIIEVPLKARTLCIHSDSEIATALAKGLRKITETGEAE